MVPCVLTAIPLESFRLAVTYTSGAVSVFDLNPWLDKGMFRALRDPALFRAVRPYRNTVEWPNGADLDPETLYEDSVAPRPSA